MQVEQWVLKQLVEWTQDTDSPMLVFAFFLHKDLPFLGNASGRLFNDSRYGSVHWGPLQLQPKIGRQSRQLYVRPRKGIKLVQGLSNCQNVIYTEL